MDKVFANELHRFDWLFAKLNGDIFLAELNMPFTGLISAIAKVVWTRELPEAKEEAGITSKPHYLANFKSRFKEKDKENAALYYFIIDHEPILDKTEIESGRFIDIDEIQRMVKIGHFIRETQVIYPLLLENKEKILKALAKHP